MVVAAEDTYHDEARDDDGEQLHRPKRSVKGVDTVAASAIVGIDGVNVAVEDMQNGDNGWRLRGRRTPRF